MRRRANHRHDVGPREGRGLGLRCIVVDVSRRHDHITQRGRRQRKLALLRFAGVAGRIEALERLSGAALERVPRFRGTSPLAVEIRSVGEAFGCIVDRACPGGERVAQKRRDAMRKQPLLMVPVDEKVDEGRSLVVHPFDTERPRRRPLHSDGGVRVDEVLHVVRDSAGELAASGDQLEIDRYLPHGTSLARPRAKALRHYCVKARAPSS